ncbi:putative bifunctional diguanylate cyclase/phosphodiesterase [Sphingomonas sp. CCH15-F11]|uniref:putative bifunctional diguanylate cyclase/phosphodiesterase n=1 Tax=Sphingomonas sp. CCH15-F11 TaxID=1768785 RepID=UPI0008335AF2|nr:EAL domain-containing protein [Sphingomonas sp. CCH15-F11]
MRSQQVPTAHRRSSQRDTTRIAISVASILLFVGIASTVLAQIASAYFGNAAQPDRVMTVALILNVALILFGWRRNSGSRSLSPLAGISAERAALLVAQDMLTGFLNRRSFVEDATVMFVRAQKQHKAVAMVIVDLDGFKHVNDMHGHQIGDALLRRIATEISDIAPSGALLARFAGDEFGCAFVFDPSHHDPVERFADRLLTRISQPIDADGVICHVGASAGMARSDFDSASVDSLIRAADIAMASAKRAGGGRATWFDRSMERELKIRNELENGLRSAIPAQEIVPYFEPQVELETGKLIGFEVLARWEHATQGVIGPDRFISIAEDSGLINDLSLSVMRQAFGIARDWDPALVLSINISPWQLRDAWLAQKIIKSLTESGFPASRLEIEVTESALFDNLALAQSIIGSLKNQGIRIALDDFGTGYSSLAHLRALPFDRIKIDRSFVSSIIENPDSAAIVNAIVRLGESLNLPVTAEGIENEAIADRLRAIGCAKGQGWHYGKPLGAAGVRRMLAERRLLLGSSRGGDDAGELGEHRLAG